MKRIAKKALTVACFMCLLVVLLSAYVQGKEVWDDAVLAAESARLDVVSDAMVECIQYRGVWQTNYNHEGDTTTYSCMIDGSMLVAE